MICPNCRRIHENVQGKCPHCGADFHGYIRQKHVVQPLDLDSKCRCAHGILRHRPCSKCERSSQDCEAYRRSILAYLKELLIRSGVCESDSEGEQGAELLLPEIDAREAREDR